MATMDAWVVDRPGQIDDHPLLRIERHEPEPEPHQIRVRVTCCGVCRTDLHLAEGDLVPRRPFDCALAGTTIGLYKHECFRRTDC